ncbi:MAG: queuosine precursor transporter [Sphingomonas phyllosphaerae]|uniref:queuosine precursor transporter n=1 Tax=Sphingomonas phyllosphaerae TaxID=257003 RepID=UPI002FFADB4A
MEDPDHRPIAHRAIPPSLFAFSIFYGGMVCIAGVLGNKQVSLGPISRLGPLVGLPPLAVEAGIFAFLLLVVTSSAVAELHGQKVAGRLVLMGFVPLLVSMVLTLVVLVLPAAPEMDGGHLAAFNQMMGATPWIWAGGIVAYGVSQTLNVTIFSWLKGREGGKLLWFRAATASALSQIVDSVLFISIAFGLSAVGWLMAGQMLAKVVLSVALVPPLIYALVAIGRRLDA